MSNIENKELNQLDFIRQKVIAFLKKAGKLFLYKKIIVGKVKDINVYYIKSQTGNISLFFSGKGEYLFGTADIIRHVGKENYEKYLKKLGYKEIKDKTGYYHIIKVKTGKEIPQESLRYYEIFETLAFIDDKLNIYRDNQNNIKDFKKFMKYGVGVYKQIADILEDAIKENKFISSKIKLASISPLEYFFYLNTGQIEKQDILKYTKQIFNLGYFQRYYENKGFKLLEDKEIEILLGEGKASYDGERILFEKYKAYKTSLKPSIKNIELILEKVLPFVEKLELSNTKNKQEQEKIKQRYEELKEYLKKKKEEFENIQKTKIHISSLEDNVTSNLG